MKMWILYIVAGWFSMVTAFVAVMHAKHLHDRGELSLFWEIGILPAAIIGLALDVAFNLTAGTLLFGEIPKCWTFSQRVRDHASDGGYRGHIAAFWKRQLDQINPGHI